MKEEEEAEYKKVERSGRGEETGPTRCFDNVTGFRFLHRFGFFR